MKGIKMRYKIFTFLVLFFGIILSVQAQKEGPYKTRASLSVEQFNDNSVLLSSNLRVRIEKSYVSLKKQAVKFYNVVDGDEIEIGSGISDNDGLVELLIKDISILKKGEDGYLTVSVVFEGDDMYKSYDRELAFMRAKLEVNAVIEDSVKMIYVKALDVDSLLPLAEQVVTIQTPRLFNNLVIAEEETDENGEVQFEFPNDIQIHEGNEIIIDINMLETDEYATVSTSIKKEWANNNVRDAYKVERGLWSPDAPFWMVITFSVLMLLVWGHYGVICYKLYLIKKEGNHLEAG